MRVSVALTAGLLCLALHAPTAQADGRSAAPSAAVALTGALPPSGEGRRTFLKLNCYGCHGLRAAGGMGPNIQQTGLGDVREAVLSGEDTGMRSFRQYVTTTDIANLAAYLNSIGTRTEPMWVDWWNPQP